MSVETTSKGYAQWKELYLEAKGLAGERKYKKALQTLQDALKLARKETLTEETFKTLKAISDVQKLSGQAKQSEETKATALSMSTDLFTRKAQENSKEAAKAAETKKTRKRSDDGVVLEGAWDNVVFLEPAAPSGHKDKKKAGSDSHSKDIEDNETKVDSCLYFIEQAEQEEDQAKQLKLYKKAVSAGEKELGPDWEEDYKGVFWLDLKTRPLLVAMAEVARLLRWEDKLEQSIEICERLLALNPNDNQGMRYELAPLYFEAGKYEQLEAHLRKCGTESTAVLLYTRALYLYTRGGDSREAREALLKAYKRNAYLPIFLSEAVDLPDEIPDAIGIGDESEAAAYVMEYGYQWNEQEEARNWMADILDKELHKTFDEKKLLAEVLQKLRS